MANNLRKDLGIPDFGSGLKRFTPEESTIHLRELIRKKYFNFALFFLFDLLNEYAYYYHLQRTSVSTFLDKNINLPVFILKCSDNTCVTIRKMKNLLLNIDENLPKIYSILIDYANDNNSNEILRFILAIVDHLTSKYKNLIPKSNSVHHLLLFWKDCPIFHFLTAIMAKLINDKNIRYFIKYHHAISSNWILLPLYGIISPDLTENFYANLLISHQSLFRNTLEGNFLLEIMNIMKDNAADDDDNSLELEQKKEIKEKKLVREKSFKKLLLSSAKEFKEFGKMSTKYFTDQVEANVSIQSYLKPEDIDQLLEIMDDLKNEMEMNKRLRV